MPQSLRRLICASLALGAFSALPSLADKPAAPVTSAAQEIVLQHVVASDVIKTLHWDQPGALPVGVPQIVTLAAQNALSVTATPAGLAQVREIVKRLDIEPRQVQIKFLLASASEAALEAALGADQSATGLPATRFLQTLTEKKAAGVSTIITTVNSVNASTSFFYGPTTPMTFTVMPHINGDGSVALVLDVVLPEGTGKREVHTLRTVQSGNTLAIVVPPARTSTNEKPLLLFVVPTVLK